MATLALAAAGAAVGGALLPSGLTVLGATLTGAAVGSQVGALAGSFVDAALLGTAGQAGRSPRGPRLANLHVTTSTEGAPIPRLYGRARLGGQVIWAAEVEERLVGAGSSGGGKGTGATSGSRRTEYRYFASFAVALAEGPVSGIGRVWADGDELDLARIAHRVHLGSETQEPDSLIAAHLGAENAPAFRGTAYVVFEALPLAPFGNRIPQLSFEVYRSAEPFAEKVRGVCLIPGSGEFVYATEPVVRLLGRGTSAPENVHTRQGPTDWSVSLNDLEATLPNARSVSLIVSWFGTDLRAGHCEVMPGVESVEKVTSPLQWSVAGMTRETAYVVSTRDGRAAYGGTPSDQTVIAAIQDLHERGIDVTLTPFILMDVPEGNALSDPYTGNPSQPAYPWRGRITVDPAPGEPGSPDRTAAAAAQLASFIGTAEVSDFAVSNGAVVYSGPDEWSFRRMVLHYAHLAAAAGGVSAFVIGTEMRGLTQVRDGAASYPFVAALIDLAADVKSVLGPGTKVTYAADWSEYFGHQPQDGSGDVFFHLDPLWASDDIDAIGIDVYWPLADWRDGTNHLDYLAGARSTYDLAYLRSNVMGGEGFDWYYASPGDRDAQIRTPITDGAGKPWVFRYKDVRSWWLNAHYDRPGGVESTSPTAWVPESKPFWFMEIGCPAVDKGANQPNVFVDPKSAESALPYYSHGTRDDLVQRRFLRALIEALDPASDGYLPDANPVSSVTGQRMIDVNRIHVYAWDARPFPVFPFDTDVWGDGENWRLGHWLNGRFAAAPLAETVETLLADYGVTAHEAGGLVGTVPGYVIDRVMSARDALAPLELAYFFDAVESGGAIAFRHRGAEPPVLTVSEDGLVEERPGEPLLTLTRAQETELPASAKITYISTSGDYRQAVAEARRLTGTSGRIAQAELPIVLEAERGSEIAESWLYEAWASRERAAFKLPPSALAVEPGDVIGIVKDGETHLLRVIETGDHGPRDVEARAIDPEVYGGVLAPARLPPLPGGVIVGQPAVEFLDLPLLRGDEPPEAGYVAATQTPWPGAVAIYGSPEETGFVLRGLATAEAVIGTTLDPLPAGPLGVIDFGARLRVEVARGELESVTRLQMLGGRNLAAVRNADGEWEVLQFESAALVAERTYELTRLLRGQAGTEGAMRAPLAAGAPFVLLNGAIAPLDLTLDEIRLPLNWRVGPASRDIADASYGTATHTFAGTGLRPFSPVHVRAVRSGGDILVSWTRRTRVGGDSWDAAEVPLAEDFERYEIDVLDGETVKRTLVASAPSVTYTAAEQTADFGAPQSAVSIRIHQLGAVYGRGSPRAAVV